MNMTGLNQTAVQLVTLCLEKNAAYGDSVGKSAELLKLLYPHGLRPNQYLDAIFAARDFDKRSRLAQTSGDPEDGDVYGEDSRLDLAGYGLLALHMNNQRKEPAPCPYVDANAAENPSTMTDASASLPAGASEMTTTNASATTGSDSTRRSLQPSLNASPATDASAVTVTGNASKSEPVRSAAWSKRRRLALKANKSSKCGCCGWGHLGASACSVFYGLLPISFHNRVCADSFELEMEAL